MKEPKPAAKKIQYATANPPDNGRIVPCRRCKGSIYIAEGVAATPDECENCCPKAPSRTVGKIEDLPVEAPVVDKPLDMKALQEMTTQLNQYTKTRLIIRLEIAQKYTEGLTEFLLKGEETYFLSLKNKVASLIQGATRIA